MATTAQRVFDIAMGLIDEVSSSGATDTSDTSPYKNRTILILNALRGELFPLSDTYSVTTSGTRAVCTIITDFTTAIALDDVIAQTVMPYGLAANLLLDENPSLASFMQQRYEELKSRLSNTPAEFAAIDDVYGIEHAKYSSW